LLAATMKVCRERLPANANRHGREPLAISFVGVTTCTGAKAYCCDESHSPSLHRVNTVRHRQGGGCAPKLRERLS
jgi:hypothetical protein